jgi:hypothetical protein
MRRFCNFAIFVIVAAMMVVFTYGMWRFPDAPIAPCAAHGFCGKQAQPHTAEDFTAFTRWETVLFWGWPVGMLSLFFLQRKKAELKGAEVPTTHSKER